MLHWKDKSEEAKGSQWKDDKGSQADITEGNCSKLLFLSKNTFLGNFLVKCCLCALLWPRFSLTISLFQLEAFCKEAFGNVSAYRHHETQKKELKKVREERKGKGAGAGTIPRYRVEQGLPWWPYMERFSDHTMASESNQIPNIEVVTVGLKWIPVPTLPALEHGKKCLQYLWEGCWALTLPYMEQVNGIALTQLWGEAIDPGVS